MTERAADGPRGGIRTELLAGLTTFLSMAYILALYPSVMSGIGLPAGGAMIAFLHPKATGGVLLELCERK